MSVLLRKIIVCAHIMQIQQHADEVCFQHSALQKTENDM